MLDVLLTTQDYDIAIYPLSAFGETGIFFSNTRKVANLNACDSDLLTSTTSKQPGVSGDMYRIVGGEVVATVITINGADEDSQPLPLPAGFTNNNYSGSWSGKTDNSAVLQLPILPPIHLLILPNGAISRMRKFIYLRPTRRAVQRFGICGSKRFLYTPKICPKGKFLPINE